MSLDEWNVVDLDAPISIPFIWKDPTLGGSNLGRAEFVVCLKYRYGEVSEFWVTPKQQRDVNDIWHWSGGDEGFFSMSSYQGLDNPKVWLVTWCKEHKCNTLHLCAPTNSKFLYIDYHGLSFLKESWIK